VPKLFIYIFMQRLTVCFKYLL